MQGEHESAPSRARILVVLGTRPEAIKLAPVVLALREAGLGVNVCATGQHPEMATEALGQFGITASSELGLMRPDQSLDAFKQRAVAAIGDVIDDVRPSWVVVQGDTGSALSGAIAAADGGVPCAHVEAGLRSFDLTSPFPEELYRVEIGRLASLHFAPTPAARANLLAEGVERNRIEVTGNTVVDALRWVQQQGTPLRAAADARRLIIVTMHRREERDRRLATIVNVLRVLASRGDVRVLMPVHPGIDRQVLQPLTDLDAIRLCAPLGHAEFVRILAGAHAVITDSGGIQEEASALGVPTIVARNTTERPEVISAGTARLVGIDAGPILEAVAELLDDPAAHRRMARASAVLGDGRASERIARRLASEMKAYSSAAFDCSWI